MNKRIQIKTDREIRNPVLLADALESMGYLVDRSPQGGVDDHCAVGNGFDLEIEDHHGHTFRAFNMERLFTSRRPRK